jgi:hypothetical protein
MRPPRRRLDGLSLLVGALGVQDQDGQRLQTFVNVFGPAADGLIPTGTQRSVRRELRGAGYQLGTRTGLLFGTKQISTARDAVRECKRMVSHLNRNRAYSPRAT